MIDTIKTADDVRTEMTLRGLVLGVIITVVFTAANVSSSAFCALGGVLGVMYSIPLRRALVTNSDLPYPEGLACAEVLKVGTSDSAAAVEENRAGLAAVVWGSICAAVFAVVVATRVFASDVANSYRFVGDKGPVTGFDFLMSLELFAVWPQVGLWVGIAMLVGALIGTGCGAFPTFRSLQRSPVPQGPWHMTFGAPRCASSAPARSASPRSGRWANSSSR